MHLPSAASAVRLPTLHPGAIHDPEAQVANSEHSPLLDPGDELPAARMLIVDEESWPVTLDFIE